MAGLLGLWPARRRIALALLFPLVTTWFVVVGRTAGPVSPDAAWHGVAVVAGLLGAAVLAAYVPVAGRRPDVGCTPCAMLSGVALVGATVALHTYGAGITGPLVATAVLLFGLAQRMNQPTACAAPVRDPR